jgi:hypothetical protein
MKHALLNGSARQLSTTIPDYVHYEGSWWAITAERNWSRVTTPDLIEQLNESAERLDAAKTAVERQKAKKDRT